MCVWNLRERRFRDESNEDGKNLADSHGNLLYPLQSPRCPAYGEAIPTLIHALLTVVPIWIIVYVGLVRVYRIYKLRDDADAPPASSTKEG